MLKLKRNRRPGCLSQPAVVTRRHSRVWSPVLLGPRGSPGVLRGRRWVGPPILPFWGSVPGAVRATPGKGRPEYRAWVGSVKRL